MVHLPLPDIDVIYDVKLAQHVALTPTEEVWLELESSTFWGLHDLSEDWDRATRFVVPDLAEQFADALAFVGIHVRP